MKSFSLDDLVQLIDERASATADQSYTRTLLDSGMSRIAKKFGEESVELVIAAIEKNKNEVVTEAADVFYHLLVLLRGSNVKLSDVVAELGRRTGQSGLSEKASR